MLGINAVHLALAIATPETLTRFVLFQAATFISLAFCSSNFSTLAMRDMAEIAGTASSVQGVIGTVGGAAIGLVIGQQFDGTDRPFLIGMVICSAVALALVLWTERGRLFARRVPVPATA